MAWIIRDDHVNPEKWTRRVKELISDPVVASIHRLYPLYSIGGLVLPAILVGLVHGSWFGVFSGFLWGGLVRLFLVNHLVWSINSVCHIYGSSDYVTQDHSRNNYWLMLPSLGFSLHNNHHAFPKAASTSHVWWQIDLCGLVIRLLAACGLAWDVNHVPSADRRARRRQQRVPTLSESAGSVRPVISDQ